ncbi:MAG: cation:proton antiporter [Gemmatimonadota bacterium]
MDPLLATLVLILLALLGARISFSTQRVPPGPRLLFRTGMHWVLLGWLLGPGRLEFITSEALTDLHPLLAVGLGWVGLLFGMQLDRQTLRQFPLGYHLLALGQAVVTLFVFLGLGWITLEAGGLRSTPTTLLLMGAAATACVTTPAGIAMVSSNFLVRGNVRQLIFFIASIDAVVGLVALQVTYAIHHPSDLLTNAGTLPAGLWIGVAVGLGVVCGIVFLWLLRPRPAREELILFLLGIAALASGAALQLQLSPLFVCVVMGALVANLAPDRPRVYHALEKWEKPIYVVLLLLGGALLSVPTWWVVPLGVAYAVLRAAAKVVGSALTVPLVPLPFQAPKRLGMGLLPQGGISLAMAVSLTLTYSGLPLAGGALNGVEVLYGIILLGIVFSELVGPFTTTRLLRTAGEISPRVEEALAEGDQRKAEEAAIRHSSPPPPPEGRPPK